MKENKKVRALEVETEGEEKVTVFVDADFEGTADDLPEEAKRSIEEFQQMVRKKYSKKLN